MSDAEVRRIENWNERTRDHLRLYAAALNRYAADDPADWLRAEQELASLEKTYNRPIDADLRRTARDGGAAERQAARRELARRGRLWTLWLEMQPDEVDFRSEDAELVTARRRAYYARLVRNREALLALGEDAAELLIDTYLQWLSRANPEEQMILRDELAACGDRVIPILREILRAPPREGSDAIRLQAMLILARFGEREEARAELERFARAGDVRARKSVPTALRTAYTGTASAEPVGLLALLLREDAAWEVRAAAAEALGDIGAPDACPPLLRSLEDLSLPEEDRLSVRKFAVAALGKLRCDEAVRPLVRLLEDIGDPALLGREDAHRELHRKALWALNRITGEFHPDAAGWRAWLSRPKSARPK